MEFAPGATEGPQVYVTTMLGWMIVGLVAGPLVTKVAWGCLPTTEPLSAFGIWHEVHGWQGDHRVSAEAGIPCDTTQTARLQMVVVSLLSAVAVCGSVGVAGTTWLGAAYSTALLGMIAVSFVDIVDGRIPNRIIYPVIGATLLFLSLEAATGGSIHDFVQAMLVGLGASAFLFMVHLASPHGMGMGDVRLAALCGLGMGWQAHGPTLAIFGLLAAFVCGSIVGVAKVVANGTGRKTSLRFGPYLSLGAALVMFYGQSFASALRIGV